MVPYAYARADLRRRRRHSTCRRVSSRDACASGQCVRPCKSIAAKEGAGTLVWVRRFDLVESRPGDRAGRAAKAARRTIYAGLAALADALAVHAPPERAMPSMAVHDLRPGCV